VEGSDKKPKKAGEKPEEKELSMQRFPSAETNVVLQY
jgi:hypothetical protein